MAVVNQPGKGGAQAQWMPAPAGVSGVPPGLEYLAQVDQLIIKQKVELLEAFTGFETNNKYEILNSMGQRVFFAAEDTNCCTRNCCGRTRPFEINIMDNQGKEIIHLHRPLRCEHCCCCCCLMKVDVEGPPGNHIGTVKQAWSLCAPKYKIQNAEGETVLRIEGPLCQCNICGDVEFDVYSGDGEHQVGKITKQWTGFVKEMFTDADNFGVTFPLDLDVTVKATMLGAVFLIDFMFFEKEADGEQGGTLGV